MKVNQKQRLATRKKIIDAAVGVIIEKGFKSATMREIAKQAGIGDATIYNYFPTKEAILYGYYEDRLASAVEQVGGIEGFAGYTFQEQLQSLLGNHVDPIFGGSGVCSDHFHTGLFFHGAKPCTAQTHSQAVFRYGPPNVPGGRGEG